jgi:hypothetical protein
MIVRQRIRLRHATPVIMVPSTGCMIGRMVFCEGVNIQML